MCPLLAGSWSRAYFTDMTTGSAYRKELIAGGKYFKVLLSHG
jgi:hypothetical protein